MVRQYCLKPPAIRSYLYILWYFCLCYGMISLFYRNPCNSETIEENGGYYFPHHEETNFVQCDDHGGCFVMPCGPDTKWDQEAYTCVHA